MRMRTGLFAMLAAASGFLVGCGETDTTPPPGTDINTPNVEIDEGAITSPGDMTEVDDTKNETE